jgi:hypothetical protein
MRNSGMVTSVSAIGLLGLALLIMKMREQPPLPATPSSPPAVPATPQSASQPGPPVQLKLEPVDLLVNNQTLHLRVAETMIDPAQQRVIAYFVADDSSWHVEQLRSASQMAWNQLRVQLPIDRFRSADIVVVQNRLLELDAAVPKPDDPNVLAHGVVTLSHDSEGWPEQVTEWR